MDISSNRFFYTYMLLGMWVFLSIATSSISAQPKYELLRSDFRDGIRYSYYDLSCSNDSNCTSVGYSYDQASPTDYKIKMLIERTTDGGQTWHIQPTGLPDQIADDDPKLKKIFAIDSLNIVVAGDSGWILRSTNAGISWNKQVSTIIEPISGISFSDSAHGIVISRRGYALTTRNGGYTWERLTNLPKRDFVSCKAFSNEEQSIFQYAYGPIFHTNDAWKTWDTSFVLKDTSTIKYTFMVGVGAYFLDPKHIWVFGAHKTETNPVNTANCYIVSSTNGGMSWERAFDSPTFMTGGILACVINSRGFGVASGIGQGILFTSDNGLHWKADSVGANLNFYQYTALSFPGKSDVFMIGRTAFNGGVIKLHFPQLLRVENYEALILGTHVYPNPSVNSFTLYANTSYDATYSLYDILGRKLKDNLHPGIQGKMVVNTEDLSSGAYNLIAEYKGIKIRTNTIVILRH